MCNVCFKCLKHDITDFRGIARIFQKEGGQTVPHTGYSQVVVSTSMLCFVKSCIFSDDQ